MEADEKQMQNAGRKRNAANTAPLDFSEVPTPTADEIAKLVQKCFLGKNDGNKRKIFTPKKMRQLCLPRKLVACQQERK